LGGELSLRTNPSALGQTLSNGQRRFLKSPIIQVEIAKIKLEKILKNIKCQLPVETAVVMAYPSQFVENVPPKVNVWSAEEVLVQLYKIHIKNKILNEDEMYSLGHKLLSIEQQYHPFPLAPNFNINLHEIETGVFCPRCRLRKMERNLRKWECGFCDIYTLDSHLTAIDEWFMICKSTITTNECKDFLGLPSIESAQRALKRKQLKEAGGRRYRYFTENKPLIQISET
jgi:hypothetical protein